MLILVTGATDGIGRETALELARRGAAVIVHGRDPKKLKDAHAAVAAASTVPAPEPVRADLASLEEVRALARELDGRGVALDVLVNNAGIFSRRRAKSADGFELTFAVNHLAPFLLTHLVLHGPSGAKLERVVNVSSMAHASGSLDARDPLRSASGQTGYDAYATSKLANVLFSVELAKRLAPRKIDVNSLHPGVVSTNLLREGFGGGGPDSLEEGAATSVHLALSSAVRGTTGKYFVRSRETRPSAAAQDAALARRLYDVSCEATGARPLSSPP
jgi:NAD(P)-dependent dehydrogenase (short-subunit alcohol dehydrogenase family)